MAEYLLDTDIQHYLPQCDKTEALRIAREILRLKDQLLSTHSKTTTDFYQHFTTRDWLDLQLSRYNQG